MHKSNPDVPSAVRDLMEVYRATDFQDTREVTRLLKSFHSLSARLEESGDRGYWALAQVGTSLCEVLQKSCVLGPQGLTALIESVVVPLEHLSEHTSPPPAVERPSAQDIAGAALAAARVDAAELNLNLQDGLRIGQLLMTMSLLTAEDVQEALLLQRSKDIRLGEALVELGKVSPEMVETALDVQRHRRSQATHASEFWTRQNPDVSDTSFHKRA